MTVMEPLELRKAIAAELEGNLLPFWRERSVDEAHGGFIAEMANDSTTNDDTPNDDRRTARYQDPLRPFTLKDTLVSCALWPVARYRSAASSACR